MPRRNEGPRRNGRPGRNQGSGLTAAARAHALAVSQSPVAMAMFDRDMRYLAASRRWHTEVYSRSGRLVGRVHYAVFPQIPERWRALHRRALAGETLRSEHDIFAHSSGEILPISWIVEPWYARDGSVGGITIATAILSSEQVERAERDMLRSELDALFEQRIVGILVADWQGEVIRANRCYLELVQARPEQIVGASFTARVHESDRADLQAQFAGLRGGACESFRGRHRAMRPDGSAVWLKHSVSVLRSADGVPARAVVFVTDATARVELEQQMRSADRLSSIGLLGASLGHDMNNVLLPIRANLNAMRALLPAGGSPTLARSLENIEEGVAHLQHLADAMHYLADGSTEARGENGSIDVRAWWEVVEPLVHAMLPTGVDLKVELADDLPELAISGQDLTRAVMNLVANARDAVELRHGTGAATGMVALECRACTHRRRRAGRISIRDNGAGMTESVRAQAGEPFFTTKPGGTGLGIYSVRRAVELAGGSLVIQSVAEIGSTVAMVIPMV